MTLSTSYLPAGGAARDQIDWNPDFSRRARGFAVYAALRELGRDGLAALVERTCRHAQAIVAGIGALEGAEALAAPVFNQGLVRFLSPTPDATAADHDRRTDEVIAAINAGGEAFFGGVTWRGLRCMRVSVCNWRTTEADVAARRRGRAGGAGPTLEFRQHRVAHLHGGHARRRGRGCGRRFSSARLDRGEQLVGQVGAAQRPAQRHLEGQDRGQRIGDPLAGDVRRRAVDRLVEAGRARARPAPPRAACPASRSAGRPRPRGCRRTGCR